MGWIHNSSAKKIAQSGFFLNRSSLLFKKNRRLIFTYRNSSRRLANGKGFQKQLVVKPNGQMLKKILHKIKFRKTETSG